MPLGEKSVIGPFGLRLTVADPPPADARRWVIRRKAEAVAAVRGGPLSMAEACERCSLTPPSSSVGSRRTTSTGSRARVRRAGSAPPSLRSGSERPQLANVAIRMA